MDMIDLDDVDPEEPIIAETFAKVYKEVSDGLDMFESDDDDASDSELKTVHAVSDESTKNFANKEESTDLKEGEYEDYQTDVTQARDYDQMANSDDSYQSVADDDVDDGSEDEDIISEFEEINLIIPKSNNVSSIGVPSTLLDFDNYKMHHWGLLIGA